MVEASSRLRLLHVIPRFTLGGAGRSLVELIKRSPARPEVGSSILSLAQAESAACATAASLGAEIIDAPPPERWADVVGVSDLVLFHFWNSPEVYRFLQADLSSVPLVLWLKVMGDTAPHALPAALLERADYIVATTPGTLNLPELAPYADRTAMVPAIADFTRVARLAPRAHPRFTVSYIGTVDFVKLHRDFVSLCAGIRVPGITFPVCGAGTAYPALKRAAETAGAAERFEWRGRVEDIGQVLEVSDVFGYPLCEDTYATSEKSLQEAMLAGVPPVVFPYGGIRDLVRDNRNGLVAANAREYREAVEYLYHHPEHRAELGRRAAEDIRKGFDADAAASALYRICIKLLQEPGHRAKEAQIASATGAESFILSLGDKAPQFAVSRYATDPKALFDAEQSVASSSPALCNAGAGGILHYRASYPDDPYLRLWSGLVYRNMGRPAVALAEFTAAERLGLNHWRLYWYQAQSARDCGATRIAEEAIRALARLAPEFARERGII